MIERITDGGEVLALLLRGSAPAPAGVTFFTPPEFSQQLGLIRQPTGHVIEPHLHNPLLREVKVTQEVLVLRRGRLRVDFYRRDKSYVESRVLEAGDVILLCSGGHGFEVLEEVELVEVKQGPYVADRDKVRFEGAHEEALTVRGAGSP